MKTTVDAQNYDLEVLWKERQKAIDGEAASAEQWNTMPEEEQVAVRDLIFQALGKLREDMDWVPYSMDVDQGSYIQVGFRMLFSDIQNEVLHRRYEERQSIDDARDSTTAIVSELEAEIEADEAAESEPVTQ